MDDRISNKATYNLLWCTYEVVYTCNSFYIGFLFSFNFMFKVRFHFIVLRTHIKFSTHFYTCILWNENLSSRRPCRANPLLNRLHITMHMKSLARFEEIIIGIGRGTLAQSEKLVTQCNVNTLDREERDLP